MRKLENLLIYREDHRFHAGDITVRDGYISEISISEISGKTPEYYVIPGLIDIHFHGCMGMDLCDATQESLKTLARYEAGRGVTSICPASMSMSKADLRKIMRNAGIYEGVVGSRFVGVNMEGPFLNKRKKGAQSEKNIISCDVEFFKELQSESHGKIRMVDIAPECSGAMDFIDELHDKVTISLAHTEADYDVATEAFKRGAKHVTHMCNAMPELHHREPGVIGAAYDAGAYVEMICDGVHIHPSMVRCLYSMFTSDKICFISDSMRATGLTDGRYTLGGQEVNVTGPYATLRNGTIAGSVSDLMTCMVNAVKNMGIPLEGAIRCATENPAKAIGIFDNCGSITPGKYADLVILDKELSIQEVILRGSRF